MQNTTNFNLNKPEGTDIYNIQNENDNMDIIDAALAKAHSTDDSASTDLADGDYLPFYDTSATEKKKMLLSTARKDVRARIAEAVSNDVIETIGAKALNSYSVGQYFLGNDGYYYAATAAITANTTTLNSGVSGNCSKTSIAAGMNSLTSQISNLEGKVNDKYLLLGTKVITLATGNGSRTCNTLMTLALTALNAIVPSSEVAGATHMKPVYCALPYADGAGTRTIVVPESGLSPVTSFSSSSYKFIRVDATPAGDGITLWNADFAATNKWLMQTVTNGAVSDFLTRKPSNGTTLDICLEFYAKY